MALTVIKIDVAKQIYIYAPINFIEKDAILQANDAARLPITQNHIVLLPDSHIGYGIPIGCVWATDIEYVCPYACGSDIGCGVTAAKTGLAFDHVADKSFRERLIQHILTKVLVGRNWRKETHPEFSFEDIAREAQVDIAALRCINEQKDAAGRQMGTLGSGNHFIELQVDENRNVWVMVHCGSRNIGKQVCDFYHDIAKSQIKPGDKTPKRLASLTGDDKDAYLAEMRFCVTFAKHNRLAIIRAVFDVLSEYFPLNDVAVDFDLIDVPHNYAAVETHFDKQVMVHRKGATRAFKGEIGIIPGSQGTSSYIVEGLGNAFSFKSCSHGAGRAMSRKEAKQLNLEEEQRKLDKAGVVHTLTKSNLDEATSAYKDVNKVIEYQEDLIKVKRKLTPVMVVKG